MDFRITSYQVNDWWIIASRGDLDQTTSSKLLGELEIALISRERVVLDLGAVYAANSTAMNIIITMHDWVRRPKPTTICREFRLIRDMSDRLKHLLAMSGYSKVIVLMSHDDIK